MVLHVAEDVVVDVAEEVDLGFDAPVVTGVEEGGMLVEHAAVPAAHLVVGIFVGVLDVLFFEDLGGFFEEVVVDPWGDGPVVFGDKFWTEISRGEAWEDDEGTVETLCFCLGLGPLLE